MTNFHGKISRKEVKCAGKIDNFPTSFPRQISFLDCGIFSITRSFVSYNNRPSLRLSRHNRESSMAGLVYKASSSLVWPRYYWNQSNDNQEEEWNLPRRFASLIISNIDTCVARISSSCVLWGNNEESVWISEQQVCFVTNKYIYIKEYFYYIYVLLLLYYFYVVLHTCDVLN